MVDHGSAPHRTNSRPNGTRRAGRSPVASNVQRFPDVISLSVGTATVLVSMVCAGLALARMPSPTATVSALRRRARAAPERDGSVVVECFDIRRRRRAEAGRIGPGASRLLGAPARGDDPRRRGLHPAPCKMGVALGRLKLRATEAGQSSQRILARWTAAASHAVIPNSNGGSCPQVGRVSAC